MLVFGAREGVDLPHAGRDVMALHRGVHRGSFENRRSAGFGEALLKRERRLARLITNERPAEDRLPPHPRWIANDQIRCDLRDQRHKLACSVLMHDEPTRAGAALPGRDEGGADAFDGGGFQIGIGHDERAIVAAQLKGDDAPGAIKIGFENAPPDGP